MPPTDPAEILLGDMPLETTMLDIGGRSWSVTAVFDQDTLLDVAERFAHIPYGLLLWEASLGLARRLVSTGDARIPALAARRVLELGAGLGLAGLVAQAHGAHVVQTDHEPVALALARRNAAANSVAGITQFTADWRHWDHAAQYDLIIGADIVYDQTVHDDLAAIFARNLAPDGTLLLADPGRPRTLEFLSALEDAGWAFTLDFIKVEGMPPARGRAPVEISIITARRAAAGT